MFDVYCLLQLMGMWHTVEIIQHRDEQRFRGVMTTDTCPMVHLSRTGSNDLKMMWHEPAGYVEYRFRITDPANPGFWLSWGPQNGNTSSSPLFYKQTSIYKYEQIKKLTGKSLK